MGTLTINYDLYKPSVKEQGWGDEVNENFDTIDGLLKDHEDQLAELSGSGHVIEDSGVPLIQRDTLNFVGYDVQDIGGKTTVGLPLGYWAPLTDGDLDDPQFIFAEGQVVMVWVDL